MAGNSIGKNFCVTTFGESHGNALGCIIDGCPPGVRVSEVDFQVDLERRRPGRSHYTTQRSEPDKVKILSGIFEGRTTGTPIGLMVLNTDHRPEDYSELKDRFRPGHADYTYYRKYGVRDHLGGGRASARETVMRVAAGVIAKKYLKQELGIDIRGYLSQMGSISIEKVDWNEIENNAFFCPDVDKVKELDWLVRCLKKRGDSVGAKIQVTATQVLAGLGEPVFDRLDAEIAHALMSINAVKGVEIGDGFAVVSQLGSQHRDISSQSGFSSNHSGGILGGISTGQDILATIALKPTSSITAPNTPGRPGELTQLVTKGRHDPCVGIRAVPIAEAMLAIVLMDHLLRHRGQNVREYNPNIGR